MPYSYSIEFNGKLLDVHPVGQESLMDALERVVSSAAGEPIRQCAMAARGPAGQRTYAVTFESGVTLNAHILQKVAEGQ